MNTDRGPPGAEGEEGEEADPDGSIAAGPHSVDEVRAALTELYGQPETIARIVRIGRNRARGTNLTGEDLVQESVTRLLRGKRHWRRDETLVSCLARTMRSIVMDWWRDQLRLPVDSESALSEEGAKKMLNVRDQGTDLERSLVAKLEINSILASLGGDTLAIAELLIEGNKPAEIRDILEISQTTYDSALKQIARTRKKVRAQGDNG